MSTSTRAGAAALLAGPLLVIVGTLVQPTISDEAADRVTALADHRAAMIAGAALSTIAAVLLTAGIVWLALAVASRARLLAVVGGVLAVLGMLLVLFEDGVAAAGPSVVAALDPAHATAALHAIETSAGSSVLEPLTIVGDVGFALLAVAAARAGVSRVAAVPLGLGMFVATSGFATGARAPVVVGFAILLAGAVPAVRTLVGERGRPAADAIATAA